MDSSKVDRLILFHGLNGSAKTSLVPALTHDVEIYSQKNEGALYRIKCTPWSGLKLNKFKEELKLIAQADKNY